MVGCMWVSRYAEVSFLLERYAWLACFAVYTTDVKSSISVSRFNLMGAKENLLLGTYNKNLELTTRVKL